MGWVGPLWVGCVACIWEVVAFYVFNCLRILHTLKCKCLHECELACTLFGLRSSISRSFLLLLVLFGWL